MLQVERSFRVGLYGIIARSQQHRRVTAAIEDASCIDYLPSQPDQDRSVPITSVADSRRGIAVATALMVRLIDPITFHQHGCGTAHA